MLNASRVGDDPVKAERALIADEFGGKVDLVIGDSATGLIVFCLAAKHPPAFEHIVVAATGYAMTERGQHLPGTLARQLIEHHPTHPGRVCSSDSDSSWAILSMGVPS